MSKKQKIKVGFTKEQHDRVHQFLGWLRETGQVEKDLGAPVNVTIEWGPHEGESRITFTGMTGLQKVIPIKEILEADDSKLKGPVLKLLKGKEDEH